jgi:hypothetical protein
MCFANDMQKLLTLGVLVFMEVLWDHSFKHVVKVKALKYYISEQSDSKYFFNMAYETLH